MTRRRIPSLLAVLAVVLSVGAVALLPLMAPKHGFGAVDVALSLLIAPVTTLVGALIAARCPGNAIGWLLCAAGLAVAIGTAAQSYALIDPPPPAREWAAWLGAWAYAPVFGCPIRDVPGDARGSRHAR